VKPHNIILSETDKRLKLIDLGACAGEAPAAGCSHPGAAACRLIGPAWRLSRADSLAAWRLQGRGVRHLRRWAAAASLRPPRSLRIAQ
jgi:serine/threonine protein kinase